MGKIKQFIDSEKGKDILVVIIVILVGLGSFGLGRLSKGSPDRGIKVEYLNQEANIVSAVDSEQEAIKTTKKALKGYFASNRGSKYYPVSCSAGKSIKQENRVYFNTSDEAEQAGYELSASC